MAAVAPVAALSGCGGSDITSSNGGGYGGAGYGAGDYSR